MTDEELAAKTILFNQTLMQYGRAKALRSHLGTAMYRGTWSAQLESELLTELSDLLDQIKTEIESRRNDETKEQAATGN